jgi:hypothetical protein
VSLSSLARGLAMTLTPYTYEPVGICTVNCAA